MILFDGCSWTYGDELINRETDRFSSLISKESANISYCGKSNDAILRTTIDYCENNHVDFAVIQFTVYSRTEYRSEYSDAYDTIQIKSEKALSKIYYENIQNNTNDFANYHKNKFLLENYFKTKGIKYYFVNLERSRDQYEDITKSSWYNLMDKTPVVSLRELIGDNHEYPEHYVQDKRFSGKYNLPKGWRGGHPNKKGHQIIANHILEKL